MMSRGEVESQQPPMSGATKDLLKGCSEKVVGGGRNEEILGEQSDSERGSGKTRQVLSSHTAPYLNVSVTAPLLKPELTTGHMHQWSFLKLWGSLSRLQAKNTA